MTARPLPSREREPSHAEIISRIDILGAEMRTRFDATDRETDYIRGRVDDLADDVGSLKADVKTLKEGAASPASAPQEHDGGLPFKHGWRSWTVIGVAVITGLAALKAALGAMDAIAIGIATAWHNLTH